MSHAIRRRPVAAESGPPDLEVMLRHTREDFGANVRPSIRRHREFVGPGERRRTKAHKAAQRGKRAK